jgi:hypothetical protein
MGKTVVKDEPQSTQFESGYATPPEPLIKSERLVKVEPDLAPAPIENNTSDPNLATAEFSESKQLKPLWKLCDNQTRVQQVTINEDAADQAQKYFEGVEKVLNEYSAVFTSCDTRLKEIGWFNTPPMQTYISTVIDTFLQQLSRNAKRSAKYGLVSLEVLARVKAP